eukprot:2484931-Prymnesium_polylepis.2
MQWLCGTSCLEHSCRPRDETQYIAPLVWGGTSVTRSRRPQREARQSCTENGRSECPSSEAVRMDKLIVCTIACEVCG